MAGPALREARSVYSERVTVDFLWKLALSARAADSVRFLVEKLPRLRYSRALRML